MDRIHGFINFAFCVFASASFPELIFWGWFPGLRGYSQFGVVLSPAIRENNSLGGFGVYKLRRSVGLHFLIPA